MKAGDMILMAGLGLGLTGCSTHYQRAATFRAAPERESLILREAGRTYIIKKNGLTELLNDPAHGKCTATFDFQEEMLTYKCSEDVNIVVSFKSATDPKINNQGTVNGIKMPEINGRPLTEISDIEFMRGKWCATATNKAAALTGKKDKESAQIWTWRINKYCEAEPTAFKQSL